jgi:hypothetical protein
MYHLTNAQLLVGVLALLLVVLTIKTVLEYRKEQFASYRAYLGSGHQRNLFQRSRLSDHHDRQAKHESWLAPFRLPDPHIKPRAKVSGRTQ